MIIVRYADDAVFGFQRYAEAKRFARDLAARLRKFGLHLHPEKTRLIEFGRFAAENRRRRGQGKPGTFDFLGFTHLCSRQSRDGWFTVRRKTVKKRLRKKLQEIKQALVRRRHRPVPETGAWLSQVLRGYYNYHAIPGNRDRLKSFCAQVEWYWLRELRRRSQRHRLTWTRYRKLLQRWIPKPRIVHPYPEVRFFANNPR